MKSFLIDLFTFTIHVIRDMKSENMTVNDRFHKY